MIYDEQDEDRGPKRGADRFTDSERAWAELFEALGVSFDFHRQGGDADSYSPVPEAFWLRESKCWFAVDEGECDVESLVDEANGTGAGVLVVTGPPGIKRISRS